MCDKNQTPAVIHGFIWRLRRRMQAHATRPGTQSKMPHIEMEGLRVFGSHSLTLSACECVYVG